MLYNNPDVKNMRLQIVKSKNAQSFYIVKSTYIKGKRSNKVVEKLGTLDELKLKLKNEDPYIWAKKYVEELNKQEKEGNRKITIKYSTNKIIDKNNNINFNVGYIFLEKLYYDLKLNETCKKISDEYRIKYDLNKILQDLIYTRIIEPCSKSSSFEVAKKFIEQPDYELHDIYRALEVIAKGTDFIESEVYKNSLNVINRNSKILYYDCTNYFFEIEQAEELKQYGKSKEHRQTPIVQMGLFMDGNGLPLAFNITSGNTNEQTTLKPLEEQIMRDFEMSKFVVCTDAGLASIANRKFNNIQSRSFIVTQSLKKIKKHLQEWALSKDGWHILGSKKEINLNNLTEKDYDKIFYKDKWINENGLEQRLIVSYSQKYADYQKHVREEQIQRAKNIIEDPGVATRNLNDPKRFINVATITEDGEIADKKVKSLNIEAIKKEEQFDGFYAVCTTLEDDVKEIIKVNKNRWEIEESFRILKTDFKARPVYLKRDDRIKAHFTICFLSLLIFRILEKKLKEGYTSNEIIKTLREMKLIKSDEENYIPIYTRTDLTDELHNFLGARTDYEITSNKSMKNILKSLKK